MPTGKDASTVARLGAAKPVAVTACAAMVAVLTVSPWLFAQATRNASQNADQAPGSTQTQAPPAASQQPPLSAGKIAVRVKEVTLYATVRDKHGKIVPNLSKDDFTVEDDGNPQTISYFARESDLPLTLGPLVDTSISQRSVLGAERDASYAFLDHMLRGDKDKAFLIHFDREVELLQDVTSSREKLQRAIQLLETPRPDDQRSGGDPDDRRGGRGRDFRGGGTLLYDAIYLASNDIMKKEQGRKALIVLSDGVDRGSKESLEDAIAAAQHADTAVYTILFAGEEEPRRDFGRRGPGRVGMGTPFPWPGRGPGMPRGGQRRYPERERTDGKKVLQRISLESGGRFFEVSKKQSIDRIYSEIAEDLRNQYSIGYVPSPTDASGSYHRIRVTAKGKDLTVFARQGYYAH